jgi:hypothetical protein
MHAYDAQGNPRHTVIGKNGKERTTTITDVRKNRWFPSVTTVLGILPKDFLSAWQMKQIALAAFASPPHPEEDFDGWYGWLKAQTDAEQQKTLDIGTAVHAALEAALLNQPWDAALAPMVTPALELIEDNGWTPVQVESVVVSPDYGCAGTVDLVFEDRTGKLCILDFKTKKTQEGKRISPYTQYPMQLAAYHMMKWGEIEEDAECHNLFISTTEEGRIHLETYKAKDIAHNWLGFCKVLAVYRWLNNLEVL